MYSFSRNLFKKFPYKKTTCFGMPSQVINLGRFEIDLNTFMEMIEKIAGNSFRKGTYNIFKHNCNNFTDDLTNILFNKTIR